jgi:hypothetical protein
MERNNWASQNSQGVVELKKKKRMNTAVPHYYFVQYVQIYSELNSWHLSHLQVQLYKQKDFSV